MNRWKNYWYDFLHIFFPTSCVGCNSVLRRHEELLCLSCIFGLPYTQFHTYADNESARQLWGKLDFVFACSMLKMPKESSVENMIYQFKYQNRPEIGFYLGKIYGRILSEAGLLKDIDLIVPIPIHASKRKKRGYNQSEYIAKGICSTSEIPMNSNSFIRKHASPSQTKKSRSERYDNVINVFDCIDLHSFLDKHILLVDDVLTTGATIVSAGNTLIQQAQCKVSVATIVRA